MQSSPQCRDLSNAQVMLNALDGVMGVLEISVWTDDAYAVVLLKIVLPDIEMGKSMVIIICTYLWKIN